MIGIKSKLFNNILYFYIKNKMVKEKWKFGVFLIIFVGFNGKYWNDFEEIGMLIVCFILNFKIIVK